MYTRQSSCTPDSHHVHQTVMYTRKSCTPESHHIHLTVVMYTRQSCTPDTTYLHHYYCPTQPPLGKRLARNTDLQDDNTEGSISHGRPKSRYDEKVSSPNYEPLASVAVSREMYTNLVYVGSPVPPPSLPPRSLPPRMWRNSTQSVPQNIMAHKKVSDSTLA